MGPLWLIAEREFRAYVATASFWVALLIGPAVMAASGFALHEAAKPRPAPSIVVKAADAALAEEASAAIVAAGALEGRAYRIGADGPVVAFRAARGDGAVEARFDPDFPLSPAGRALALTTLERDAARAKALRPVLEITAAAEPSTSVKAPPAGRFVLVMLLWLPLTGSLGMLLQAVVRERGNRALESLLSAARPWHIVGGKLMGVGFVSLLVMGAWLGSGAIAGAASGVAGPLPVLLKDLAQPALLVQAVAVYLLAFLFYGLATVAVGASAQDSAAAQNYARPLFMVLLCAFFAALAAASGTKGLEWLIYLPPFSPFMLLLTPQPLTAQAVALSLLAVAAGLTGMLAVRGVTLREARSRGA